MPARRKGEQKREIKVEVEPIKLDEVPGEYVNYMFVVHSGDEFQLYFSEVTPPPRSQIPRTGNVLTIKTKPKVRLTIAPTVIPRIIDALRENYQKYEERTKAKE